MKNEQSVPMVHIPINNENLAHMGTSLAYYTRSACYCVEDTKSNDNQPTRDIIAMNGITVDEYEYEYPSAFWQSA
jgi:hypothetical protein